MRRASFARHPVGLATPVMAAEVHFPASFGNAVAFGHDQQVDAYRICESGKSVSTVILALPRKGGSGGNGSPIMFVIVGVIVVVAIIGLLLKRRK